ncbi:MAG TPA: HAD hydrolase family protein [Candidatus Binatia bacterium]|nr:HAD hydrolase family protein [Candidatus Binatia bacterium]
MTTEVALLSLARLNDAPCTPLAEEHDFYNSYTWCLNAYPSIGEVVRHLDEELTRFHAAEADWRRDEIARNVYLLACTIIDTTDDHLLGRRYNFSKVLGVFPALSPLTKAAQATLHAAGASSAVSARGLSSWRAELELAVIAVVRSILLQDAGGPDATKAISQLRSLLHKRIPVALAARHPRIPAAFRSQDLTHFDVLSLGAKFVAAFPDRKRAVLVTGLRTAGSYFAVLLRSYLESRGYTNVEFVTLRPKAGISPREKEITARKAAQNCLALLIDEPIATGATLGKGIALLTKQGISMKNVVLLFPVHRNGRNWKSHADSAPIVACRILTLEHGEWYKHKLISATGPQVLKDYFESQGWQAEIDETGAEGANARLNEISEDKYHTRLKWVYSVRLSRPGETITQQVIAKSVGWGWLGYHAFVGGQKLAKFVPPIIGLRDGILYSKWVNDEGKISRDEVVRTLANYTATRTRELRLSSESRTDVLRDSQAARGIEELAGRLSIAYGKAGGFLKRARMKRELAAMQSHEPTLIDARMRSLEWIASSGSMLKSDFEQHGMGKHQLNLTDPAYDLAEAILHWKLSPAEEEELLRTYAAESGDQNVYARIMLQKILAGSWSLDRALENLNDPRMRARHEEFNQKYIDTWNFLVVHTARFCARLCHKPAQIRWSSPLAVLDVDGVIDQQVFGYPSTTFAGIQAISLLHQNGFAIALNTARSVPEMKEYCQAYGFAGGVSEYGAHVWDGISGREKLLLSDESLEKLEHARRALRQISGVYLNDDYQYSIKAYTYEKGRSVPLPKIMVQDLLMELGLEDLSIHPTFSDTAILASETDKGRGLTELLSLTGLENAETYAVGDSSPDLRMFQVATHSFAPGHIACAASAKLIGCRIASQVYQNGFLECAQAIVKSNGKSAEAPTISMETLPVQDRYLINTLQVADRSALKSMVRAMLDPSVIQNFIAD